jgi:hypothetical protein
MPDKKETLGYALKIVIMAPLYALMNMIPLAGAVFCGAAFGYCTGGSFKRGLFTGFSASLIGSIITLLALNHLGILAWPSEGADMLLLWLFLAWNLTGIILCALASGFGALGRNFTEFLPPSITGIFASDDCAAKTTYKVCSGCGTGNMMCGGECVECGKSI